MEAPQPAIPKQFSPEYVDALQHQAEQADIYRKQLEQMKAYDNEWIKFMSDLSNNKSALEIVEYINWIQWTDKQKQVLIMYTRGSLGRGLSTTYLTGKTDYLRALDDFELIDSVLTLGMSRFDLTPEFHHVIGMINAHRKLDLRRSMHAYFVGRIGTQTTEFVHEERQKQDMGFKEKVWNRLGV